MAVSMSQIKKLRAVTGAGVMDAKRALEEAKGDLKKAEAWIAKKGVMKAAKKTDRKTAEGIVYCYVHHDGKSGAMIELLCETDFVARNSDFKKLAHELAMQVTSMNPKNVNEFLKQEYIRDPKKKIKDLIDETVGKIGENIKLSRLTRYKLGDK